MRGRRNPGGPLGSWPEQPEERHYQHSYGIHSLSDRPCPKGCAYFNHPVSSTLQSRPYSNPRSQLRARNPSREVLEPRFRPRWSGPRVHIPNCHTHRLYWEGRLSHLGNREDWRSGRVSGWEPAGVEPRHLHSSTPRGRDHSQAVYSGRTVEATCKR